MPRPSRTLSLTLIAVAFGALGLLGAAAPASAVTAQRTFVASSGSDANPCSLALPCRSFNAAIAQTSGGGEVVILDTAGYGPMVINKSIKIIGPSGVYGGISVVGGVGVTTGIVINAGDTDVVTLRGLDISGVPGSAPLPNIGIDVQNVGTVHIEKSSIGNFTQDTSACINAVSAKPIQIFVNDSFLRECRNGIYMNGTGPDDSTRMNLIVDNTRIEHMLNTGGVSGTDAVRVANAVVGSLRNSVISFANNGVHLTNVNTSVKLRFHVMSSQITRMGNAALETGGAPGASLHISLENSLINNTQTALIHGHGQAIFVSSVIANNANSLVDCGAGAANVSSLGYGGGNGSNAIYANTDSVLPPGCAGYVVPTQITGM
jgi:hypothetical protein